MRVAVIDVGSNSVRLLVASVKRRGLVREVDRDRVYLRLGDDAYRLGRIGARKLDELDYVAERYAQRARLARVERFETIVTAPGRQSSNADELVDVLVDATRAPVTVLSAEDEARLAWEGAVASLPDTPSTVAVVDLGRRLLRGRDRTIRRSARPGWPRATPGPPCDERVPAWESRH